MTLEKLQDLVRVMSNRCYMRYWIMWNYPQSPTQMALRAIDERGKSLILPELEEKGFKRVLHSGMWFYVICRTEEDGSPWERRI